MGTAMKDRRNAAAERIDLASIINDVWHSTIRRWWLILATMVVVGGLFCLYPLKLYDPMYKSIATIAVNALETSTGTNQTERVATSLPYILQSDAKQQVIADNLKLDEIPGEIMTSRTGDTNMLTVEVTASDPKTSYAILCAILENYGDVSRPVLGEIDMTILENSGEPKTPFNRMDPKKATAAGALAGLLIWLVIFAAHSALKRTIRSEEELKRYLNLKCLSDVPQVKVRKNAKATFVGHSFFQEKIRTLRTRIERDHADTGASVYMVTSALAGEGKTTIAVNLALSLAGKGRSVVIVDMDLRKPSVMKTLKQHRKLQSEGDGKGIGEILAGEIRIDDALMNIGEGSLKYLPAGKTKTNVMRTVNDPGLEAVFKYLRTIAEYVIIDTPPSSQVSDAAALVKYADSGIFVIRQDYAPLEYIREGINILDDTGLPIAGCVLNQTVQGIMDIAYGYRNYGYGYGESDGAAVK